ncbi:MAG: hypothetical protein ABIQ86_09600 [Steroidobacteraceae bacterium]
MKHKPRHVGHIRPLRSFCVVALFAAQSLHAQTAAPTAGQQSDPLVLAARVQQEVVDIRSLPFKRAVSIEKQSTEGFGRYLDSEMAESAPGVLAMMDQHFDKIVRRLGLYRGPVINDFRSMMRTVMTSQVAAYYDPKTKRVYILAGEADELERGLIYAHELYHALQDQYFDLSGYTDDKLKLNGDQSLARVAVIEGEATYIHTLWAMRQVLGGTPPRALIAPAISMQAGLAASALKEMVGESAKGAAGIDEIPPFLLELMVGNYLKGAAFVFALQEQGWPAVEKLYKEYPPQSTEQILHPEKWVARENPSAITWPAFDKEKALKDWELIDEDVLGEIQWRSIFNAQGLQADAEAAAAGWDGDRYAVFKRRGADETLLLLRTSWDSEAEATQFAEAYRRLLTLKYKGATDAVVVEQHGVDVFIVEGGQKANLDALIKIVRQARKTGA